MATQLKRNSKYSEAEWTARLELAACYHIFAMMGWDEMIFNHITVKVPEEDGSYLINPYGMHFSEVSASNLIKIDINGNKVDADNPWHVNKAGFVQHSLFHREVRDAHAIIHTHTTATMAVCSVEGGLRPAEHACNFIGQIGYHDFEGVTVREEEGARLLQNRRQGHPDAEEPRPRRDGPHAAGGVHQILGAATRLHEIQLATASMGSPVMIGDDVVKRFTSAICIRCRFPAARAAPNSTRWCAGWTRSTRAGVTDRLSTERSAPINRDSPYLIAHLPSIRRTHTGLNGDCPYLSAYDGG